MPLLHRHLRLLLAVVFTLLCTAEFRAEVESPSDGYVLRRWLVSEGLPHNITRRVVQDKRGFLWIATLAGLARFDGHEFKLFRPPGSEEEFHYNIRDLAIENDDTLVMLPAVGGVVRLQNGTFSPHPLSEQLKGKTLLNLFCEPNGTIWVHATDGTIARWQAGRCQLFGPDDMPQDQNNNFIFARDGRGRVWLANGSFLGWHADGKIVRGPLPAEPGLLVAPSRAGGIWISSFSRLMKLEGEHLSVIYDKPDWPAARSGISGLFEASDGVLWVATHRGGLFRYENGRLIHTLAFSELVSQVTEDTEKNLWVALAGGGLARLRTKPFQILGTQAGLPDNVSLSLCDDASGVLWCANRSSGLVRFENGKIQRFETKEALRPYVTAVTPDIGGNIWVGSVEGLYKISSQNPEYLEPLESVPGTVHVLLCTLSNDLWVGSGNNRLGRIRNNAYQAFTRADGFPEERVSAVVEDARGSIWISTNRELFELVEGKFIRRLALAENLAGEIHALHVDSRGSLWLGTTKGLLLRHGDQYKLIGLSEGLPGDTISQILEDDQGRLWCGGRSGLFTVALNDLYDVAEGRISKLSGITFGADEGLPGNSSPTGRQPMAWKARDGRLWFASSDGLVGINPTEAAPRHSPPPTYIDEVFLDGKLAISTNPLVVQPGVHQVTFAFAALNYSAPEKIVIKHQLVGFDPVWIESTREFRASYVRLPPGRYEMRVIAANQDGDWAEQPATMTVVVVPAWWQQWWFPVSLLIAFTSLVVWLVRYWSHRRLRNRLANLQREHALDQERARIARDLHDELGGSLTQIRMLAERLRRHAISPEAHSVTAQIAARTRHVTGELESIVWTVSPKNQTWDRLAAFIGQYSLRFFRDTSIACTVHGVDLVPALPLRPDQQHHILALTKEALNNILKHAQATRVAVTLRATPENFELEIADNGTGFDLDKGPRPAGNGLTNMRTRAREIGGTLEIHTAPGASTRIILRLNWSPTEPLS